MWTSTIALLTYQLKPGYPSGDNLKFNATFLAEVVILNNFFFLERRLIIADLATTTVY